MKTALVLTVVLLSLVIGCQHRQLECTCKYQEGDKVYYISAMDTRLDYTVAHALYNVKSKECNYLMEDDRNCLLIPENGLIPNQ